MEKAVLSKEDKIKELDEYNGIRKGDRVQTKNLYVRTIIGAEYARGVVKRITEEPAKIKSNEPKKVYITIEIDNGETKKFVASWLTKDEPWGVSEAFGSRAAEALPFAKKIKEITKFNTMFINKNT